MSIQIPFSYLQAAVIASSDARHEVRFYLCGVAIGDGIVAGTNGHVAVIIEDDELKDKPQIIIPREVIQWMERKIKSHLKDNGYVYISEIDEPLVKDPVLGNNHSNVSGKPVLRQGRYIMSHYTKHGHETHEIFTPIDGKFPDVMRVLGSSIRTESSTASPSFNPDYLNLMIKAKKVLNDSPVQQIRAYFGEPNEAVYFPLGNENWHGVVMPMRS